uniref:FAF domain-containing protein n=1 Tax=Opuntia streptacantha TaxID=393608 RepID=A0A7C8ZHC9_OPUST
MATCRGIHHIFDTNPAIPENLSSFIDSISNPWTKINPPNPIDHHSFTEIFGELHFKENPNNTTSYSSSQINRNGTQQGQEQEPEPEEEEKWRNISKFSPYHRRSESSSSMNSESLQLCTEGLGFESLDNLEDLDMDFQSKVREKVVDQRKGYLKKGENKKGKDQRGFPPPISSIGGNNVGKPWVCFESYKEDGRFILKEVRIPTQECLHACREHGRLRLSFVQETDEDGFEEEEQEEEQQQQEEEGGGGGNDEEEVGEKEGKTKDDLEKGN